MSHTAHPLLLPETGSALAALAALIEGMLHAVWLVDARALRIVGANRAAGELLALPAADLVGKQVLELAATPEELCFWGEVADGTRDNIESDTQVRRFDGRAVPVTRRVSRVRPAPGLDLYVVALHDRSEQVRAQGELEVAAAQLAATLESTADGILVTDLSGRIRHCNQRFAQMWGVPPELLMQRDDDALLDWMRRSVLDPAAYMRSLATLDEATLLQSKDTLQLHDGTVIERVSQPQFCRGRPIGRVYSFRDLTEKIEAGERIETLSSTDVLTGLPNRRRLDRHFNASLAQARRERKPFAMLVLNLDHFRRVNDTLGHALGDRVLVEVAQRLRGCLRQGDAVARVGGDEFALLLHLADVGRAEASAARVLEALRQPFNQADINFTVTASLGVSMFPNDGETLDTLIDRADAAMRQVKESGRAGVAFHRPQWRRRHTDARSRLQLDHAMRLALKNGLFCLHYQPQVDLESGVVRGAEALIRWMDPVLGEVPPGEFIPVAEDSGFIMAIGDWVLHAAVQQAAAWHARGLGLVVSVNVSALQFQQPGFVDGVARALREASLPAARLELELTESMLMNNAPDALERLHALAALGVSLAIDDFGTGFSCLSTLKRLPIHRLKIDRSFVQGLPTDASDAGIVTAILGMGRALHLQIVAEGVETDAQRRFLKKAGCDQFQGFLFAKALEPLAFEARLLAPVAMPQRLRLVDSAQTGLPPPSRPH